MNTHHKFQQAKLFSLLITLLLFFTLGCSDSHPLVDEKEKKTEQNSSQENQDGKQDEESQDGKQDEESQDGKQDEESQDGKQDEENQDGEQDEESQDGKQDEENQDSKQDEESQDNKTVYPEQRFTLKASIEQETSPSADTRLSLAFSDDASKSIVGQWDSNDQITLFFVYTQSGEQRVIEGGKVTISNISVDKQSCSFEGDIPTSVPEVFTLIGVTGMSDLSTDGTSITASVAPRPFKRVRSVNDVGSADDIPMSFALETSRTGISASSGITFKHIGSIHLVSLLNTRPNDPTVYNFELTKSPSVLSNSADWFYQAENGNIPYIDLLTGIVTMQRGTYSPSNHTTSVAKNSTAYFAQWIMPKPNAILPEVKMRIKYKTRGNFQALTNNTNVTPGFPAPSPEIKAGRIIRFSVNLDATNDGIFFSFVEPYIIQTDGSSESVIGIENLKKGEGCLSIHRPWRKQTRILGCNTFYLV